MNLLQAHGPNNRSPGAEFAESRGGRARGFRAVPPCSPSNLGNPALSTVATSLLEQNLLMLARTSPEAARAVAAADPRGDVRFFAAADGSTSAEVGTSFSRRLLASAHRPREEAHRLVGEIDLTQAAMYVVNGFGVGHHVELLSRRLGKTGVIVVFEPDLGLLRSVVENVDLSWLAGANVAIVTDADDQALIARIVDGVEGMVAMGVRLIEHPASRAHIGSRGQRFHERFADIVKAVKMTVTTTMVQVKATMRNLTQNLDRYVESPGVADLAGCCRGRPAIVVSAGPSLARNMHVLARPGVRDEFVIIAVQTVLKPLLERGVRPHFVTALDHSEISRRFYEGLTGSDLDGVTLVVDPKVNPAVLEAWPREAALRISADRYLDRLLGEGLACDRGALKPGATVAHLAYYLARHLGCDPVGLIGQDLGFTDGQYYAAGAAMHRTWACELNEFNTLEMLEWQRIARMGAQLRKAEDVLGRPMYTDEQMATYLVQFEKDFKEDVQRGLRVVDATEGGVRKRHSEVSTLVGFIDQHGAGTSDSRSVQDVLDAAAHRAMRGSHPSLRRVEERVHDVRNQAVRVADISRRTGAILAEMEEHQQDQPRVNRLIGKVETLSAEIGGIEPAFSLANTLNQTGTFNRVRADRAIQLESQDGRLTPMERQRRQLVRDQENVRLVEEAAGTLIGLLDETLATLRGGKRTVRETGSVSGTTVSHSTGAKAARIGVVLFADAENGLLGREMSGRLSVIQTTLLRLSRCGSWGSTQDLRPLDVVVLATDPVAIQALLGKTPSSLKIHVIPAPAALIARRRSVLAARAPARECWRGGIANLTAFDEVFEPAAVLAAMDAAGMDGALIVGADWAMVDPELTEQLVERFQANRAAGGHRSRIAFTQAPPGACGCIVSRELVADLANAESLGTAGNFASIGGVLGYIPSSPVVDLLGLSECLAIPESLRDDGRRLTADSEAMVEGMQRAFAGAGVEAAVGELLAAMPATATADATELVLICGCRTAGWMDAAAGLKAIDAFVATSAAARHGPPRLLTLRTGFGDGLDPLDHPGLASIVSRAKSCGLAVHLRTPLTSQRFNPADLLSGSIDVLSVDLSVGHSSSRSHTAAGIDAVGRLETLVRRRHTTTAASGPGSWRTPWIVPRIVRCDATYTEVESFYRKWLVACGWAVIDPLDSMRPGERIAPLPPPEWVMRKWSKARRIVTA